MRALVQRVSRARVDVDGASVAEIGRGLLVLLGVGVGDGTAEAQRLAEKVAGLRVFEDAAGRMNRSVQDIGGAVLLVSQFTLYGDTTRGRRPSFERAAEPALARDLVSAVALNIERAGIPVRQGRFGAHMQVELVNDGPVTILLEAESPSRPATASRTSRQ